MILNIQWLQMLKSGNSLKYLNLQHSLSGQRRLLPGEIWLCERPQWHLHVGQPWSGDGSTCSTKQDAQQLILDRSRPVSGLWLYSRVQLNSKPEPDSASQSSGICDKLRPGPESHPEADLRTEPARANFGSTARFSQGISEDRVTV